MVEMGDSSSTCPMALGFRGSRGWRTEAAHISAALHIQDQAASSSRQNRASHERDYDASVVRSGIQLVERIGTVPPTPAEKAASIKAWEERREADQKRGIYHGYRRFP